MTRRFAVIADGEIVDDPSGWLAEQMEFHAEYDWSDAEFLLNRYDGPTVVALAKGADAERLRALGWRSSGPPSRSRDRLDSPTNALHPSKARSYLEVDGDRAFNALALYQGTRTGTYLVEDTDESGVDLLLTIVDTDETIPVALAGNADCDVSHEEQT